jgi:hypothetical protein
MSNHTSSISSSISIKEVNMSNSTLISRLSKFDSQSDVMQQKLQLAGSSLLVCRFCELKFLYNKNDKFSLNRKFLIIRIELFLG